ncbi:MBL fold metallo-hydrolase [Chryseobacterium potabilaquae]|uniref:N-acyl homoserine lactonase AiiA n=1 Tax=Chryseobacterium potabilaquae TaxID=2675057 RepID=A0A6N4X948_9FLAO|nr:MBL fold metallo-hydrolase [Chryseobacterium potabilaquae]CAA7194943.1 N-acyl homoserine lactonase AiiA [Chryseobacterium potabilaquae]
MYNKKYQTKRTQITRIFILNIFLLWSSYVQGQMNYKILFGKFEVTALLDGTISLDVENILYNQEKGEATKLLQQSFIKNPVEISINAYLIKTGSKIILIDTGAGELFGGKLSGKIVESLKSTGYTPSQITDILLTHIHGDHSGGLTVQGKRIFENATIHVNKSELEYWMSEKNKQNADVHAVSNNPKTFQNAINILSPYIKAEKIKTFDSDMEILPGINTILIAGHTPGHTAYFLENGKEKMMFWGDLVHVGSVQFMDPLMEDHFDVSLDKGKKKRFEFYEKAAQEKYLIAANHISFPGFGHLRFECEQYIWIPIPYSIEGRVE